MLQALIKKGRVLPAEVPAPMVSAGGILVKVVNSCISAGTEISSVQRSGKSLIQRGMEHPNKVLKTLEVAKTEGITAAINKIRGKWDMGSPTGYSAAGIVLSVGEKVVGFAPGDQVAVAGAGAANHAEYVDVPVNLSMHIPCGVGFRAASTIAIGGIAMQGVRRISPHIGEYVVIFGTGILGLLALQILSASGVRTIAVEVNQRRLNLARELGAELCVNPLENEPAVMINHYTNGYGADAVLFCASTEDPRGLSEAFAMTRKKGRLVMLGDWGRELKREEIYAKELDFLISTSYGPGRYDANYEERGIDYPYAYVRWTEKRNMLEYLHLLESGKLKVDPLIQGTYRIEEVEKAYASFQSQDRPLIVLLDYGEGLDNKVSQLLPNKRCVDNKFSSQLISKGRTIVGIVGAGRFATGMHLPNLRKLTDRFEIRAICNRTGVSAQEAALACKARYATTDYREILADADIDLVMVFTKPNLHGQIVLDSLKAGKHTFVEKPLCTRKEELEEIKAFFKKKEASERQKVPLLMVGFNRRFSNYAKMIKKAISERINPLFIHYRMNAGYVAQNPLINPAEGEGRIIGEACHVIDLFSFLIESPVRAFTSGKLRPKTNSIRESDNASTVIEYEDGSLASLNYFTTGSKSFSKEYMEIHFDGKTIVLDDFKSIEGFGVKISEIKTKESIKGHADELIALSDYLTGGFDNWPIALESLLETTLITFEIENAW
jgi:predicted dehydrogenase/threonine dehydrogenase-like Zn-dependent dehydrogenase